MHPTIAVLTLPKSRSHLLLPPAPLQYLTIGHTHCSVPLHTQYMAVAGIFIQVTASLNKRNGSTVTLQNTYLWAREWASECPGVPRLVMVTVSIGQDNTWLKVASTVCLFGCYGHHITMRVDWHKYHQMAEHPCLQQSLVCEWRRRLVWFLWLWPSA